MYPEGTGSPCAPRSLLCDPVDTGRINGASNPCERILLERVRVGTRGRPCAQTTTVRDELPRSRGGGNGNGDLISVDRDFKVNNRPRELLIFPLKDTLLGGREIYAWTSCLAISIGFQWIRLK